VDKYMQHLFNFITEILHPFFGYTKGGGFEPLVQGYLVIFD